MSQWRAVTIEHARKYADLPIISSSFEMATVVKGLMFVSHSIFKLSISSILELSYSDGALAFRLLHVFFPYSPFLYSPFPCSTFPKSYFPISLFPCSSFPCFFHVRLSRIHFSYSTFSYSTFFRICLFHVCLFRTHLFRVHLIRIRLFLISETQP